MSPRKRIGVMIPSARVCRPEADALLCPALGITRPIAGFGRLLENLTPARSVPAAR